MPSPSFTLMQSYATKLGPVHHFDLWRLDGPAALPELGFEDALADIVLVEWPDRLGDLTPPHALHLRLSHNGAGRLAELSGEARWLDGL